jgi:tRNA(fMet)-specific endonuclease VapC
MPFGRRAAERHGRLRFATRQKPVGPNDLVVAATALAHDATLITANDREFSRIPDLRVENWR